MIKEGSRSLVGKSWVCRTGSTIFVYGEIKGTQFVGKKYLVACSICSKDSELYPEISMNRTCVRDFKLSCGCSIKPNYTQGQKEVLCKRKAQEIGVVFCGFSSKYKARKTEVTTLCHKHQTKTSCYMSTFFERKACCSIGGVEISLDSRLISKDEAVAKFISTGKFTNGTEFIRIGRTAMWEVHCPICKNDEYALSGIKSIWTIIGGRLSKGVCPCRCSIKHYWTQEEYLKKIAMTGEVFAGWDGDYVGNSHKDRFFALCEAHGKRSVSVSALINGRRCPGCAKSGFDRTSDGFVYCLKSDDESILKVGITKNTKTRFTVLRNDTPFGFSVVGFLSMHGSDAAKTEKMYHDKFMSAGLSGFNGATEWLIYDDEIVSAFS
jgi:hypothetical protein